MNRSMKVYWEKDTSLEPLKGKQMAIIGYGNQGRAQALNLRDNGLPVVIGSRPGSGWDTAAQDGFEVLSIPQACEKGDFVFFLIPDEVQPKVYEKELRPGLQNGNCLVFASGYNITYERIHPPGKVDVVMVAPRMIGEKFRERFREGVGTPAFVAVGQDATGEAMARALAIGKGIGAASGGLFEVTFQEETYLDLYMEQVVWAGIMQWLADSFDLLVEEGLPPEILALEYFASGEMAEISKAMGEVGCFEQMRYHSHTSQFGTLFRGREMIPGASRHAMLRVLRQEIHSGHFADEWEKEQASGMYRFERMREQLKEHPISLAEERLRRVLQGHTNRVC